MIASSIVAIFGKRGSGKTTLARSLSRDSDRILIYDPLEEYDAEKFYDITVLGTRLKHCGNGPFRLSFVPQGGREEDGDFLLAYAKLVKNCTVILEELDLICSANYIPPHLSDSVRRGRHFGVTLIGISRAPQEVSRLFTSQASKFYIYKFSEPRHLEYFRYMFGDGVSDEIGGLSDHAYIVKRL